MPLTAWGSRAAGRRGGRPVTSARRARIWAGVVPQQPPTILTHPSSTKRRILNARLAGVSAYWPRSSGSPAVGQAARLDRVRLAHLVEGDVARDRDRAGPRAHGADDESRAGDLAGEAGRGPRDRVGLLGEAVLAEDVRRASERVGRDDI